jgi:hypothetical protein
MPEGEDTRPFPVRWLESRADARPDSIAAKEIRAAVVDQLLNEAQLLARLKELCKGRSVREAP